MSKYSISSILIISIIYFCLFFYASAQYSSFLTATLDSSTPSAQSLSIGAQQVDLARITLSASGYDIYLNGIELGTDVANGLSNFIDIKVYDTYGTGSGPVLKGTVPNQSTSPYLVQFGSTTIIANGTSKTYLIKASLSNSAAGQVRIGFKGFTFSTQEAPTIIGMPVYGNVMTLPGVILTPTPSPTPFVSSTPVPITKPTPASLGFTSLAALGLSEGDTISAVGSSDPDIYIANEWGFKRLFLNPAIFGFYGHLGGFVSVKTISSTTRDVMVTSGLFRNCEINDPKVYGVEVTGEDTGILHWVNTSGSQAVADDPEFFKKVFCINSAEFNWYSQGSVYTSVNQVPTYSR